MTSNFLFYSCAKEREGDSPFASECTLSGECQFAQQLRLIARSLVLLDRLPANSMTAATTTVNDTAVNGLDRAFTQRGAKQ